MNLIQAFPVIMQLFTRISIAIFVTANLCSCLLYTSGDNVIIINADKVQLTGNKWNDKVYLSYTGYPGGQREITPARLQAKPNGDDTLLRKVVKGMLPKTKLGAKLLDNMYVLSLIHI